MKGKLNEKILTKLQKHLTKMSVPPRNRIILLKRNYFGFQHYMCVSQFLPMIIFS